VTEDEDAAKLLKELESAFGSLPVLPDDRIVIDNSGTHLECAQIRSQLRGRHWRDLSRDELAYQADMLAFLTPEGYRHFLPAFVRLAILDPDKADLATDTILWNIAGMSVSDRWRELLDSGRDLSGFEQHVGALSKIVNELEAEPTHGVGRQEWLALLSAQQKSALLNFIEYLRRYRQDEFRSGELEFAARALQR